MMRITLGLIFFGVLMTGPMLGEVLTYASKDGAAQDELVIYSTLDNRLAAPLIAATTGRG